MLKIYARFYVQWHGTKYFFNRCIDILFTQLVAMAAARAISFTVCVWWKQQSGPVGFAVERLLVCLLLLVGVALYLVAFLQPSALSWASSLTWGRRSVSDCFMYALSPMQHSASAGLTLKVIPFSSFSHIDWKLRAKKFGMQEGPGASVMSAYVELVFDNTDRRLPVSTITAPRKESIDLIKLLCASLCYASVYNRIKICSHIALVTFLADHS